MVILLVIVLQNHCNSYYSKKGSFCCQLNTMDYAEKQDCYCNYFKNKQHSLYNFIHWKFSKYIHSYSQLTKYIVHNNFCSSNYYRIQWLYSPNSTEIGGRPPESCFKPRYTFIIRGRNLYASIWICECTGPQFYQCTSYDRLIARLVRFVVFWG